MSGVKEGSSQMNSWTAAPMRPRAKTINVFRAYLGAQLTICAQKWRNFVLFSTVSLRFVLSRVCIFLYSLGPWSTWRILNRLRVQKWRCRAMMKMCELSHTWYCVEWQTMSHLMTCGDAPKTDLAVPSLTGVNWARHWEESIWQWLSRTRWRTLY